MIHKQLYFQNKSINEFVGLKPDFTSPDWPDRKMMVHCAMESMPETALCSRHHAWCVKESECAQKVQVICKLCSVSSSRPHFVGQKWEVYSWKSNPSTLPYNCSQPYFFSRVGNDQYVFFNLQSLSSTGWAKRKMSVSKFLQSSLKRQKKKTQNLTSTSLKAVN